MSKFTFISQYDKAIGSPKSTIEFEAVSLDDVLRFFEDFLRGAGYEIDGQLMIYKEEEHPLSACFSEEDDLDDLESIFTPNKSIIK